MSNKCIYSPSEWVTEVSRRWSGVKLSILESFKGGDISAGWAVAKFGPIPGNFGSNSFSEKLFNRRDWKGSKCSAGAGAVVAALAASWDLIHSAVASCCWAKLTAAGDASWLRMAARWANLGRKSIWCCNSWWCGSCWWCGCCCMLGKNDKLESGWCCCRCCCCCCCCCWSRWDNPTSRVSNISESEFFFIQITLSAKLEIGAGLSGGTYFRGKFRQSTTPLWKFCPLFSPRLVVVVVVVVVFFVDVVVIDDTN